MELSGDKYRRYYKSDRLKGIKMPKGNIYHLNHNRVPCLICNGAGTVSCIICEGMGQLDSDSVFVNLQDGDKTCLRCSGTGKWKCNNCEGVSTIPVSEIIKCPYCCGTLEVGCFWCAGNGIITEKSHGNECATCSHCGGTGKRTCPDCGGNGHITALLRSAPIEEWRRRIGAEFERNMLGAISLFLQKENPASLFFQVDKQDENNPVSGISMPLPTNDVYRLIDDFEDRIMAEDPEGYSASFEDLKHPYMFYQRCRWVWDLWWHDIGLPEFPYPDSVLDMLYPDTSDDWILFGSGKPV